MLRVTTSKGQGGPVEYIMPMARTGNLLIGIRDERVLSEIAKDFEGCESIKVTDDTRRGETRLYDGFVQLVEIRRAEDGNVRVIIAQK